MGDPIDHRAMRTLRNSLNKRISKIERRLDRQHDRVMTIMALLRKEQQDKGQ